MLNTSIGYHSDVEYYNLGKVDFLIEIITLPVILPSNMFVAYLIIRGIKTGKSKSVPNMLVLALSISDLMTGVLGYPLRIISYLFRSWVGGSSACLYEQFVLKTFISFSEFVVVLLGVERYLSIGKPFFYDKHCSMKLFYIILAIFLGIALLLGTFSMLTYTNEDLEMHVESHNLYCFPPVTSNSFIKIAYESWLLAQGLVLITAMLFCNISVDRALASLKKRVAMTCPRNRQEHLKQQDMLFGMSREFSRLMTAINITFVVCMAPSLVSIFCSNIPITFKMQEGYFNPRNLHLQIL